MRNAVKRCKRCELLLSEEDFYSNYKAKDGLHTKCKRCSIELALERRRRLKEKKISNG